MDDTQPQGQGSDLTNEECVVYLTEVRGGEWNVAVERLHPRSAASSVSMHADYAAGFGAALALAISMRCQLMVQPSSGEVVVIAKPWSDEGRTA